MEENYGIHGEEIADALFGGIDLNDISHEAILGSLVDSPENIKELIQDKVFPMDQNEVLSLFIEFVEGGLVDEKFMKKALQNNIGKFFLNYIIVVF